MSSDHPHQPCPFENCGSSDAFNWNEEGYGFCHSCGQSYPSSKGLKVFDWVEQTYPVRKRNMKREVKHSSYKDIRGLDEDVAKLYGIQRQYDEDGEWIQDAFKYPNNVKYRDTAPAGGDKKFWFKNKGIAPLDLFGPDFNAGSSKRIYITEGECFPPTAQVLTPEGWVSFQELGDQKVYQVTQDGYGEFVSPLAYVDKNYTGDLISYNSGSYHSCTTEGHNLVRLYKGGFKKYKSTKRIDLPVPRVLGGSNDRLPDTDKYRFWIMVSADFTLRSGGDIYGGFKKTRKIERAESILNTLGIRYVKSELQNGYTSFYIHRGQGLEWVKKELPWEIVFRSDRNILLEEIIHWDGNQVKGRNQSEYSTVLDHNAEVVQTLAHNCGYVSTIIRRSNQFGSWLKVSILYGKTYSTTQQGYTRTKYSGRVMCVTVPSGLLLVRQGLSISISGNCDAASLFQILGKTYPVKSLPSASIGDKFIKHNHAYLDSFQEIVYAGELDKAGKGAAERLYQAYPTKFWYVPMSKHKDANDFLTAGDGDDLKWAALKPQRYSPDNFFSGDFEVEKAIRSENPYEYIPTGHEGLDNKIRGLVKGGVTFVKAERGLGKTEVVRFFEVCLLRNSDANIALLHAEEQKSTTYRSMATYELGVNVRTKEDAHKRGISEEQVIEAAKRITQGDRTLIFEMRSADPPEKVLEYMRLACGVYGAEYIMIDHIQRLAYMSSQGVDGATAMLTTLGAQAAQLAKEYNVGIIFISQVNSDGRTKYASALEEEAIISIKLSRNVESEDPVERNKTELYVDKNRPFSKLGPAGALFYDEETTLVSEFQFDV